MSKHVCWWWSLLVSVTKRSLFSLHFSTLSFGGQWLLFYLFLQPPCCMLCPVATFFCNTHSCFCTRNLIPPGSSYCKVLSHFSIYLNTVCFSVDVFLMLIWFGYLRFLDFYGLLYFTSLEKIYYLKDLLSFLLPSSIPSTCRLLIWNSFKFLNGSSGFPCSGCVLFISLNMLAKFTVSSPVLPWLCLCSVH